MVFQLSSTGVGKVNGDNGQGELSDAAAALD